MNDLIRPACTTPITKSCPWPTPARSAALAGYDVVGPVCETGDTFARQRALPPLAAGDLIAFATAGAYGAAMCIEYNSRLLVPEVLVKGDRFSVVREGPAMTRCWPSSAHPSGRSRHRPASTRRRVIR